MYSVKKFYTGNKVKLDTGKVVTLTGGFGVVNGRGELTTDPNPLGGTNYNLFDLKYSAQQQADWMNKNKPESVRPGGQAMSIRRNERLRAAIKAEVKRQLEAKARRAAEAFRVGDRVILTRRDSIQHHRAGGLSITGKIVELREDGYNDRNFRIEFDDDFGTGRKLPGTWWAKSEFKRYSGPPDKGKHLNKESVAESAQGLDRRQLQLLELVKDAGPRGYEIGGFGHPDASKLYRAGLVTIERGPTGLEVLKITPEGQSYGEAVREQERATYCVEVSGGWKAVDSICNVLNVRFPSSNWLGKRVCFSPRYSKDEVMTLAKAMAQKYGGSVRMYDL